MVITIIILQSSKVESSYHMEKEGLSRGLNYLQENELTVKMLVTDRHKQISAWMRRDWTNIQNKYDVWHLAKCKLAY